jgi:ribonuclease HI
LLRDRVLRSRRTINHHIYSSLWSSIKNEFATVRDNSAWLLGDGEDISFWNDSWCGLPIAEQLNLPEQISQSLVSTVSDFIVDGTWVIPPQLSDLYPTLISIVSQVSIPSFPAKDKILWKHTDDGDLQLKEAYQFKLMQHQELVWAKAIWNIDIPPSKSLLAWRIMHGKVPTDENLMSRGCYIPSMCNLCNSHVESSFHIFFECSYAIKLWSWLAGCINLVIQFSSMEDMWKLCDLQWSPQSRVTMTAAIVNLLNIIWLARNQSRFNNTSTSWQSVISMIITNTALSGNNTKKTSSNSIRDFSFLKLFGITIHHPRAMVVKEIIWQPPLMSWIKCNIDGASSGNPGNASCGGVFRNSESEFISAFAEPLGVASSYFAELSGALRAIEIAYANNWNNFWLESDSSLVVNAFRNPNKTVAWLLRNRWKNMLGMLAQMNCIVTHVYREGNVVADLLANFGLNASSYTTWHTADKCQKVAKITYIF